MIRSGGIIRSTFVVALLVATGGDARASAPDLFGFGLRSPALAATGTATSVGWEATYENPAGVALAPARRLTVGYLIARYDVSLDGAGHPIDGTNALLLGADLPLPLGGALANRLALALGFYLPTGVINRASYPFPDQPSLPLLDSRTQTVSVMACAALRITDHLSLGAGAIALAELVGAIHLDADGAGHISTQSEEQLVTDYAPLAGIRFDPVKRLRLGAVFRGKSDSRYEIRIDNKLGSIIPFQLPVFVISGVSQYDPLQVAVEAAYDPRDDLTLVAQLAWKHWSAYPIPNENATAGAPTQPDPAFHDTVVPRVAAEWRRGFSHLVVAARAGYFFEWSPAPDASPMRTLLDASRHVITVGGELQLKNRVAPLHLELFFQWHQIQPNERVSGGFGVGGIGLGAEL